MWQQKDLDLTSEPLLPKIIVYTIPVILTGLLQTLYNAADMLVVGYFSSGEAMGAVGACGSLIALIVNLFFGLSVGTAVLVAKDFGSGNHGNIEKTIHTSVLFAAVCGVFIGIFGFIFASPLLQLMGTTPNLLKEAVPYMKAYFVGVPANIIYNYLAAALRSKGDTRNPLIFLAISGLSNVLFNFIMVYFLGLSAVGVGIATTISQYFALALILHHMMKLDDCCKFDPKKLKIHPENLRQIISIGIPAGMQGTLFALSNVLIQSTVNSFGDITIEGNSAAANIESFVYISMNALYHTALTFIGQSLGKGKKKNIPKISALCLGCVCVVGITMSAIALIFARPLLGIYSGHDENIINAALVRMSVITTTYFLCGVMDVGCGISRGMGRSILPMVISLVGSCLFRIVWIYTVCKIYPDSITVLYMSYPISWILTSFAHFISCTLTYKKLKCKADG